MADHAAIDHTGLTGVGGALATDTLWDAAGDLVQGTGANTAAKLGAGTAGKFLTAAGAAAAVGWGQGPLTTTGDLMVGATGGTPTRLAIGATNGMVLGRSGGVVAWFLPPGTEYSHDLFTSGVNITATTEGTANTVVTATAFAGDGATPILIGFYSPSVYLPSAGSLTLVLYDGSSSIGKIGGPYLGSGTIDTAFIITVEPLRLVPSNASHTYSIRAFVGGAYTGVVGAGAGGVGNNMPGFIRITKAA